MVKVEQLLFLPEVKCFKVFDLFYFETLLTNGTTQRIFETFTETLLPFNFLYSTFSTQRLLISQ